MTAGPPAASCRVIVIRANSRPIVLIRLATEAVGLIGRFALRGGLAAESVIERLLVLAKNEQKREIVDRAINWSHWENTTHPNYPSIGGMPRTLAQANRIAR
jgi:hypothetical protein